MKIYCIHNTRLRLVEKDGIYIVVSKTQYNHLPTVGFRDRHSFKRHSRTIANILFQAYLFKASVPEIQCLCYRGRDDAHDVKFYTTLGEAGTYDSRKKIPANACHVFAHNAHGVVVSQFPNKPVKRNTSARKEYMKTQQSIFNHERR